MPCNFPTAHLACAGELGGTRRFTELLVINQATTDIRLSGQLLLLAAAALTFASSKYKSSLVPRDGQPAIAILSLGCGHSTALG